jgi:hypothetical protein
LAQRPYTNDLKEQFALIDGLLLEQNVPALVGCVSTCPWVWLRLLSDLNLLVVGSKQYLFSLPILHFHSTPPRNGSGETSPLFAPVFRVW